MTDFSVLAGISEYGKISNNTTTTIYTASIGTTRVRSVICCENAGSTPNLTLEVNDGTNSYYKRKAVAMTAGSETIFNEPFYVPQGWTVKITSSDAAGKIDWTITYDAPSRAAAGRG